MSGNLFHYNFELSGGTFSVVHVEIVIVYIESSEAQRQSPNCETSKVMIKTV